MLWALTCYFNPAHYRRKLQNFQAFCRSIQTPLVVVELVYGDQPELTECEADRLLQIRGRDVMWQKERLLNLALEMVPPDCEAIAWLDCDVVFERNDWAARTEEALEHDALVQPFSEIYELLPRPDPMSQSCTRSAATYAGQGFGHAFSKKVEHVNVFGLGRDLRSSGLGWAARRGVIESNGFYDACILGGGDRALVSAALGDLESPAKAWKWGPSQHSHYRGWAAAFHDLVGRRIGYVDGAVFHLWHGDIKHRHYRERLLDLAAFGFDPVRDIAVDANGCWRWNSNKYELHAYVAKYFMERYEDGQV